MSKGKVVKLRKIGGSPEAAPVAALGPGLHAVELASLDATDRGACQVRLGGGALLPARLSPGIEQEFAEECLRDRRPVLAAEVGAAVVVLGALQTSRTVERDRRDALRADARRIDLRAEDAISLRVGSSELELRGDGVVRVGGQKLTMDVAGVVRVLASLVELP
jgi:hypothetical protein